MRPSFAVRTIALIGILSAAAAGDNGPSAPLPQNHDDDTAQLIARLNADNPLDRDDAERELIDLHKTGRTACRRARATATPQQKIGIDDVLMHIPWTTQNDPEGVLVAFQSYAVISPRNRQIQLLTSLGPMGSAAMNTWMRVLRQDPSASVRWEAARYIRFYVDDDLDTSSRLNELTAKVGQNPAPFDPEDDDILPADQNLPLMAVAGWAQRGTNPARADELIARAIAGERENPSAFDQQAAFAFGWLSARATGRRDFKTVVALDRQQAATAELLPGEDPVPAVTDLIAEQCAHGPFPGFSSDLQTYQTYLTDPQALYSLAVLADRRHHPAAASLIRKLAMRSNGRSLQNHFEVGLFLARRRWDDDAEREYQFCLTLPNVNQFTLNYALRNVSIDRDDDAAAAKYLEAALSKVIGPNTIVVTDAYGKPMPFDIDLAWAEVHIHYLRAARQAGDMATVRQRLDQLLLMDDQKHLLARDPSMASDIVPVLDALDRHAEADRIFEAGYKAIEAKLVVSPEDPMLKNNMAWLLAETGRHLDRAVILAGEATAANPYESDYLDTQAEALFAVGRKKEAADIEARAAEYKPQSRMIAQKAERYRREAGK